MTTKPAKAQGGFTLIELVIVMALLAIIAGSVFLQVNTAHQRAANERNQLDLFQESREFMDQMSRDLRQVGYPNPRNYDNKILGATELTSGDTTTSPDAAVGLVYADVGSLYFEGGLDESGVLCGGTTPCVLYTQYLYDSSTTGGCPCLRRSQVGRAGTPGSETTNYNAEVQNVQNFSGGNNIPLFRYYTQGGTQEVTSLPIQWAINIAGTGATNETIAQIDTVRVQLIVQSPYPDLKTGLMPNITLVSTVKVNNCSQATTGQLSCAF
jgi:prepilin-type N-terminal cleavage/methylation domain-containing protein